MESTEVLFNIKASSLDFESADNGWRSRADINNINILVSSKVEEVVFINVANGWNSAIPNTTNLQLKGYFCLTDKPINIDLLIGQSIKLKNWIVAVFHGSCPDQRWMALVATHIHYFLILMLVVKHCALADEICAVIEVYDIYWFHFLIRQFYQGGFFYWAGSHTPMLFIWYLETNYWAIDKTTVASG